MALKLNAPSEYIEIDGHKIPHFREFYGPNVKEAPKVTDSGRVIMGIAHLMQRKLNVRSAPEDVRSAWMDNYFDTFDLKAQKGEEIRIGLGTYADGSANPAVKGYLALINPNEKLVNRAVNLGVDGRYDAFQGEGVFTMRVNELAPVINEGLSQKQASDSRFWRIALRHQDEVPEAFAIPGLHEEAIPYIFSAYREKFSKNTPIEDVRAMGVFPGSVSEDSTELRAWYVDRLEVRSDAGGGGALDLDAGRFVGIAPEALSALSRGAGGVRKYTTADVQAYDAAVRGLDRTLHPDVLEPLKSMRAKL